MAQKPRVTVVTPSYNQAEYLEHTIRSVLEQQYPSLEYIIVDGGSTDGSVEIIEKYSDKLSWWVSEKDEGQADAINKGLKRASGEIVTWLNSDDIFLPGALSGAVAGLETNPRSGLVYGNAITFNGQGKPLKNLTFESWHLEDLMMFRIICQPAVFMRKAILAKVGYLDDHYNYMLDHHLWLRIAECSEITYVPKLWAAARHHPLAKNVAQAANFGVEAYQIVEWMQQRQGFINKFEANKNKVMAGAHRINARYLLEGGKPLDSLISYWRAFRACPQFALRHWHRMIYAIFSLLGGGRLANVYYRIVSRNQPDLGDESRLLEWPGLLIV